MEWPALVLLLSGLFAVVKLYRFSDATGRLTFKVLFVTALLFSLVEAALVFAPGLPETAVAAFTEWGHVFCLAFVLSALALFVRESKPVFARFPLIYTALPLLIIFSYLLVSDTVALKEWLLSLYQGGALLVAGLMYVVYQYRRGGYEWVLGGVGLFLLSYILYWFVPGLAEHFGWVWQLAMAGGVIMLIYGYERVLAPQGESGTAGAEPAT